METLHHVHGKDVAQVFLKAIIHRNQSLGETFNAVSGASITLYGYEEHMYEFFGHKAKIKFLSWDKWCNYIKDEEECRDTYYHITRSGFKTKIMRL